MPSPTRAPKGGIVRWGRFYPGGQYTPFFAPRHLMPQIDGDQYEQFMSYAEGKVIQHTIRPQEIVPHQRIEITRALTLTQEQIEKPIIISQDNFIVDGHHRWYWHNQNNDGQMNVIRLKLNFMEAIAFAFAFPPTYCLRDRHQQ